MKKEEIEDMIFKTGLIKHTREKIFDQASILSRDLYYKLENSCRNCATKETAIQLVKDYEIKYIDLELENHWSFITRVEDIAKLFNEEVIIKNIFAKKIHSKHYVFDVEKNVIVPFKQEHKDKALPANQFVYLLNNNFLAEDYALSVINTLEETIKNFKELIK